MAIDSVRIAARMGEIRSFHVMDILARAQALEAQGQSIIHMEVGEPDFVTPQPIIDAGIQALQAGHTHYTPATGLVELRAAIAQYYQQQYSLTLPSSRVMVTPGASGALQLALSVIVNPGEKVIMTDPSYPCNRNFVRLLEADAIAVPVDASSGFQLTLEKLQRAWTQDTVAVMLASPANPTGTLIEQDELHDIYQFVRSKGAYLIVDEIYQGLVYEQQPCSALALGDDVFVINSFSKYFGMTGWRVGWLVAPLGFVTALDHLAQNIFLAPSTVGQYAALAALEPASLAILEQRRLAFKLRRDYLVPALTALGFKIDAQPTGAFYVYADCRAFCQDSYVFCNELLEQAGVAITPGLDFGVVQAEHHVRFAYTRSLDLLQEGVERIARFVAKRR